MFKPAPTKAVLEAKLRRYCAYQERCHQEVRNKLLELGARGSVLEEVMATLIEDDFLNEERFACAYAGGKFRVKHWGRVKIVEGLRRRAISDYCIKKALAEIDENDYLATLQQLALKKNELYKDLNHLERRLKLEKYLLSKGFESFLINSCIKNLLYT